MGKNKPHHKRKKGGNKKTKRRTGPKSTDRYRLYEESVQSPEEHVKFFDSVYEMMHGRPARTLKEDFCGTALLTAEWARTRPDNVAVGVDLHEPTLKWAEENNLAPLEPELRQRITILQKDVRKVIEPSVDIVAALNFSYFEFKTRDDLRNYFECARKSLNPDGILVLDMFGGWEAQMEVTDKTRYSGFTYVWEQTSYDPISHLSQFHIHFKFHGGGGIDAAFEYNWRLWTIPEVRELLEEAGFKKMDIFWEGIDPDTDEGDGEFTLVTEAENCPGWIAMLVASR
jgi:SAM-dependent methyltransferase